MQPGKNQKEFGRAKWELGMILTTASLLWMAVSMEKLRNL